MKFLHVIHSVNPAGGGPIEGIKVQASLDAPEESWARDFSLPLQALGPSSPGYGYSARLVPWLREARSRFDAVIGNGLWQYGNLAIWRALRHSSTPYYIFPHGMLDPWFKRRYPLKHLKKWLYWPWAEYRVLRDARAVLFTCEEERTRARESFWLYRCRERVVGFGSAEPTGDPEAQREAFLQRWPELRGRRLLLYLGRIHEKKGCRELIEAYTQEGESPLHLVMAGPNDNPYAQSLMAQSPGVTWTGMLSDDLKWGAFRAAEAFVLPSHQENFGVAVAEALACGVPVLISDKVNVWREVESHRAGLVENDDLAGIMRLLGRWAALTQNERAEMILCARKCYEQAFASELMVEKLCRLPSEAAS
jgi:glycosyltransferase involved in cell wall biosynthesis